MAVPLVVTAKLAAPYVGDPIHLDGLLALAWVYRHPDRVTDLSRTSEASDVVNPHLPLVRVSACGATCWAASASEETGVTSPVAIWQTRRRTTEDWDRLSQPVLTTAGPLKDCLIRRSSRCAEALQWKAWGRVSEVRKSLRLLWGPEARPSGFLGSARRSGAGELLSWSVSRAEHALVGCYVQEGRSLRHIPTAWVVGANRWSVGSCMPPYWLPAHQQRIPSLASPVTLRPAVLSVMADHYVG